MTYITVGSDPQTDGGNVQRICDEVNNIPKVTCVLLETHVPELLDLTPDESSHPGQDTVLHSRGERSSLGGVCWEVPAHNILYPLGGQNQ